MTRKPRDERREVFFPCHSSHRISLSILYAFEKEGGGGLTDGFRGTFPLLFSPSRSVFSLFFRSSVYVLSSPCSVEQGGLVGLVGSVRKGVNYSGAIYGGFAQEANVFYFCMEFWT